MSIDQPFQAPTTEELLGLPIDRLPEAIVAVAERLAAARVGLYVVDLEGVALRRLAGGFSMPEEVPIPQMPGPELPAGHLEELERSFAARGLGTVVPLWLRHRAIAVFVVEGRFALELEEFAARAAVALELSLRYTDRVARARHRSRQRPVPSSNNCCCRRALPASAEQRLRPRCSRPTTSVEIGSSIRFHQGAWLAVADAAGKGPRASAVSALSVAALRAARQSDGSLADVAILMDRAIVGFGDSSMFVTALLARWEYATRTLEWLTFGHPQPCRLAADRCLDELHGTVLPPLGLLA